MNKIKVKLILYVYYIVLYKGILQLQHNRNTFFQKQKTAAILLFTGFSENEKR